MITHNLQSEMVRLAEIDARRKRRHSNAVPVRTLSFGFLIPLRTGIANVCFWIGERVQPTSRTAECVQIEPQLS
jgi:hypothetical protein